MKFFRARNANPQAKKYFGFGKSLLLTAAMILGGIAGSSFLSVGHAAPLPPVSSYWGDFCYDGTVQCVRYQMGIAETSGGQYYAWSELEPELNPKLTPAHPRLTVLRTEVMRLDFGVPNTAFTAVTAVNSGITPNTAFNPYNLSTKPPATTSVIASTGAGKVSDPSALQARLYLSVRYSDNKTLGLHTTGLLTPGQIKPGVMVPTVPAPNAHPALYQFPPVPAPAPAPKLSTQSSSNPTKISSTKNTDTNHKKPTKTPSKTSKKVAIQPVDPYCGTYGIPISHNLCRCNPATTTNEWGSYTRSRTRLGPTSLIPSACFNDANGTACPYNKQWKQVSAGGYKCPADGSIRCVTWEGYTLSGGYDKRTDSYNALSCQKERVINQRGL